MSENNRDLAKISLQKLLEKNHLPPAVSASLKQEIKQVQAMLTKLESEQIHIAVFGRVSVGKSSLLNAIIGQDLFEVSVLHGKTKTSTPSRWQSVDAGSVYVIDTPGIDEFDDEGREQVALDSAAMADVVLFVIDSDMTSTELSAFESLVKLHRPIVLVLNKIDRYSDEESEHLKQSVLTKVTHWVSDDFFIQVSSKTSENVDLLKSKLTSVLVKEGKDLTALNASLFATQFNERLSDKIIEARRETANKLIKQYCIAKGVAVALNPIPVVDLISAAAVDATMLVQLSKLYGMPLTTKQSGRLLRVIGLQMLGLLAATWGVHVISSGLKLSSGGLSTAVTATTQGAIAWYSTLVVGKVAQVYFKNGHAWGEGGAKQAVKKILESLDKDSVIAEAKAVIRETLKQ